MQICIGHCGGGKEYKLPPRAYYDPWERHEWLWKRAANGGIPELKLLTACRCTYCKEYVPATSTGNAKGENKACVQCLHREFDGEESMFRHSAAKPARTYMKVIDEWWMDENPSGRKDARGKAPNLPKLIVRLARAMGATKRKDISRFGALNAHIGMNEWGIPQMPAVVNPRLKEKAQWHDLSGAMGRGI